MKKQLLLILMSILTFPLFTNHACAQGYIAASTYIGGSQLEQNARVVVSNGESYVYGNTNSLDYTKTLGSNYGGGSFNGDIVITKLSENGTVLWSRYIGGNKDEYIYNLVVKDGSVFIVGYTYSSNYPVTNGSTISASNVQNAVYTKLNANTGVIQYSTYLGAGLLSEVLVSNGMAYLGGYKYDVTTNNDIHLVKYDILTDNIIYDKTYGGSGSDYIQSPSSTYDSKFLKLVGNDLFLLGGSASANFPVTDGSTLSGTNDDLYIKFDATNGNINFATFIGGSNGIWNFGAIDLKVDGNGVYILGLSDDSDFPVTDGSTYKGNGDFYLRKYNVGSNALVFSKYLGTVEQEYAGAMEVENGIIYLSGYLQATAGWPHTVVYGSYSGITHLFLTKLSGATGNVTYSTWINSNSNEEFGSLKVQNGDAYIIGMTYGTATNTYPVTNGSKKTGTNGSTDVVLTKINSSNQICYSTFIGGNTEDIPLSLTVENDNVYYAGYSSSNNYPVTNNVTKKPVNDFIWTRLNLHPNLVVTSDNVSPASQTVCKNGMAIKLTAPAITFPADSMPTIYRNAVPSTQTALDLKYQWQQAPSASGPWTNILAAIQQDYNPQVGLVDVYYRRIANASVCGSSSPISTSSVASVLVNANTAPTVTVGNVVNTCVGSSVLLGGSPTATANGGATITSYLWTPSGTYSPNDAVANPTVTATATTIYNVLVTDNNGCQQIGQQLVNAYAANAGLDKSACDGQAVRIGMPPIAGLPGVVYSWSASPADPTMSCTSCAQPDVNPTVVTTYTLSLTVPITGGGTCTTTDIVVVTPVAAPLTANFAGPDVTICSGSTATLGMPSESGFTYTWAPGNYLVSNNAAQVTFQPGSLSMPNPDPITYFLTASKNGCSFVDQMVASVIEARAGSDGCGPRTLGEGDRTPNISETYLWTKISGDGNIIGANNLPQVNVSATTSGNTIYQLSVTHNGTTCTDQVVVPVCGCPVPNITVQAPNSCASYVLNGGTVALTATSPLNCTFSWSPSAGLSSSTGATVYLTDNVSRTYTVTATSVVDPSYFCTNTRTVNNPAWSLPVFTAKDTTICPGNSVNIGQAPVAGYDYQWSGNTSYLSSTTGSNPTATVTSTNTFPVLVTDVGSGCTTRDTASVTIVGLPANVAGDDAALCGSGHVQLGKDPQPNVTYIWTPATTYVPSNTSANPTVTVATTTSFTVVATNTLTGCSVTDTVNVTVNPAVAPFTFTNQTFCPSTAGAIPLPAGPSGMTTYSWSPASLVVNNTSNGPTATTQSTRPQSATTFILTVTNASGCIGAAPVVFTPSVSVPVTGGNKVICKDATVQLGGAPEAGATYSWASNPVTGNPFFSSTSISNPTFTPSTAGSYDVTVTKTDAGGCITTATATITVNTYSLTAIITNPTVCQNTCVEIGPASPAPGVQYFWSPTTGLSDPNTNRPTACMTTSSTTYTLTAVAANGCMDTRTVLVGVNPSPSPTVTIPVATPCLSDVTVTLNPSVSPSGSYNYLWTPNNGTLNNIYSLNPVVNLTGVGTQTYSLTVTDNASGCSGNAVATVNVQYCPAPVGTVGNYVWEDVNHNGLNDETSAHGINGVSVELFKETAAGSGNYLLSQSTQTANDGLGNPGYYLFNITESANYYIHFPTTTNGVNGLTSQTTTAATDNNSDASLTNGNTPIFAMNITGSGVAKDNMTLDAGYSTCVVDAGNSISLNCTNPSGTIGTASVSGNTYSWSPSTGLSATNIAQPTASPTATTTYTLTVNGSCSDTVTVYADKTAPTANAGSTQNLNCTTTSATIGTTAIAGNTYSWSPATGLSATNIAQPTASPTATTTYTVTVTGSNGCTATANVTVNVNTTAPTADAGSTQNLDCTTTSATIGTTAIAGNTYSWSPATGLSATNIAQPTASPTATTIYTVTVTGSNGCTATASVTVNVNTTAPTADAGSMQNLDCTTTSATIGTTSIAGNTYSWSPTTELNATNIAQPTASPTATTTYTVTVTGSNGCTATASVTVNVNTTAPTADAGPMQNLDCTTTSTTIGTTAIAGNTYSWSPATGLSATNIAQPTASPTATTIYTVTVTGSNGCTATASVTVNVNTTAPTADAGSMQNLDCTTTSATIGTTAIAGNTYSWSPATGLSATNIAQPTASPTATTTYTVTVTGSNGCTATASVTVNVNTTAPTADAGSTQNLDCTTTSATIGTTSIAGNTYSWSPATGLSATNIAQPIANPTATTIYTVTVTGSNGCTATASVTVNVNTTVPTADAGSMQNLDCTTTSATIGTTSIAGNTYSWSPATGLSATNIAQPTASPTATTTYTVTVTGSNGCTATASVTVNVNTTAPTVTISGGTIVCNGSTTTVTASGANTYVWSNTDITASSVVGVGTYTVTGTESNGCTSTSSIEILNQQGSVGNYVWLDENRNGLNDEATSAGINGVTVELWNATTNMMVQSTTTANDGGGNPGFYNFIICTSGDYKVKFPTTNGASNNPLTTQTSTAGLDNNSDANTIDGFSPTFAIDVAGTGTAKDNNTIDAGYSPKTACLGNYVWNDISQDGIQNNNEVGVSGVTVSLLNGTTNAILATLTTDAYGFYQFCNLDAGSYKVQFSLPSNYVFTGQNTSNDLTDSDPSVLTGMTDTYLLASGDSNMTADAGIYQPLPVTATVGDRVWFDADGDGVQDLGESGVSGITVSLYNCANPTVPVATTITDASGNYLFENVLAGSYKVEFTTPIGMVLTSQSGSVSATDNSDADPATGETSCFPVVGGDNITYVDAGLKPKPITTVSLGDKVWNDANQNGLQDAGETGVQGVIVTLYDATGTTIISTTETNSLGNYGFNGIPAGCYVVGFGLPSGYTRTTEGAGTDSSANSDANVSTGMTGQICIAAGQNNPTIDAGIYNAANTNSIGDKVWYDADKDGIQDAGEYGYPGAVVTLYDCVSNTIIATTTTDANGNYLFDGVANGSYYVGFGFISGYQFTAANADVTGISGANNSDANPSTGLTECVSLTGNTNITTVDAGIYPGNTRNATSSLGDIVWTDANNNGLQDNGETGVSGIKVILYQADGTTIIDSTFTDGLGNYIFTNLEGGSYVVGFSGLPSGYVFTTTSGSIEDETNSDANTSTGKTSVIALGLGEDKMSVDAGIVAPVNTVCLGDYVWIDLDNDGTQDANEPAVPGVTVKLYDNNTNTVLQVATTNSEGNYLFCGLTNGSTYSVGFENLPAGFTFTTQTGTLATTDNSDANPATGRTTTVTLGATNDLTLDAGIYSPTTAVVGNYVWYDEDADGIQDPTEAPIPGVLVTLYDNTNTAVASAITDANGGYLFTNVTPGTYTIGFEGYPSTLVPTTKGGNPSADDDSNVDPITVRTDAFTVTPGSSNLTLDAGFKANPIAGLGNYVWHDVNQNGLQDASEPAIAGVIVTLYDADGITVRATAITDGNGAYSFPNLPEGSYVVGFTAPLGFTRTQSVGALNDGLNSDIDASNKTSLITLIAGTYNPNVDAGYYIGVPLPARELVATIAIIQSDNACEVNWYTKDEENTKNFEIERSIDGSAYVKVGTTLASGNTNTRTNYTLNDNIELVKDAAVIYYRIKLIDIDGKSSYSNTINVRPSALNGETVIVYPTPFTDKLMIDYISNEVTDLEIELTDVSGKSIMKKTQTLREGMNHIVVSELHSLSSANYFIRIKDINTGELFIRKVVK